METARINPQGQITIPFSIRSKLGVQDGGKVSFVEKDNGIMLINANLEALERVQGVFQGAAEDAGLHDENDVVELIRQMREEKNRASHG